MVQEVEKYKAEDEKQRDNSWMDRSYSLKADEANSFIESLREEDESGRSWEAVGGSRELR